MDRWTIGPDPDPLRTIAQHCDDPTPLPAVSALYALTEAIRRRGLRGIGARVDVAYAHACDVIARIEGRTHV